MKDPRAIQVNLRYKSLHYPHNSLNTFFRTLDSFPDFSIPQGDLSIAFLDDPSLAHLHAKFLNDPSPTDVITFPGDPSMDFAGEICVSVDHAINTGQKLNIPFNHELSLYLVHGWLHLAGLDDHSDADRTTMRNAEQQLLSSLQQLHAIPDFTLSTPDA